MTSADLRCVEVVELVTAYLEGALDRKTRAKVEAHLSACEPCAAYLEQMRETIATVGRVPVESLSDDARATLLEAFRDV